MICPLNITQHITIIVNNNNCQQKWVISKLCPKCQYFVGAPLLSSTALILLGMEFIRPTQVVADILIHSSIMTSRSCWMLDTWCFSTFRLRMPHMCSIGFRSGDILGHSITFNFSSCHLGGVFGVVMLENSFWREGIIFCFRMSQYMLESMFPSMNRSSPVPAVVMQPLVSRRCVEMSPQ